MRLAGHYSAWEREEAHFAEGGAALLYRCKAPSGFAIKEYTSVRTEPVDVARIRDICRTGRRLIGNSLSALATTPSTSINWPVDVIEGPQGINGVVLPFIPERFFLANMEINKLDRLYLSRANPPKAEIRVRVLLRVAELMAWLEREQWIHGDFSQNNVVWTVDPEPAAYLIDVDEMVKVGDAGVRKGVKTLFWEDPRQAMGQIRAHDQFSDRLALALAIYRSLKVAPGNLYRAGVWHPPASLPSEFPAEIVHHLRRTFAHPANTHQRTPASVWTQVLADSFFPGGVADLASLHRLDGLTEPKMGRVAKALPASSARAPRRVRRVVPAPVGQRHANPKGGRRPAPATIPKQALGTPASPPTPRLPAKQSGGGLAPPPSGRLGLAGLLRPASLCAVLLTAAGLAALWFGEPSDSRAVTLALSAAACVIGGYGLIWFRARGGHRISRAGRQFLAALVAMASCILLLIAADYWPGFGLDDAIPRDAEESPFADDIGWMIESEISAGYPDGTYRPERPLTRGALAEMLYRLAGSPSVALSNGSPFRDVPPSSSFYPAVVWLENEGIASGFGDGRFGPEEAVSRGSMAALLQGFESGVSPPGASRAFSDVTASHPFFESVGWLHEVGVARGSPDGRFRPESPVTRGSIAAILHRLSEDCARCDL